jgi:hypothetical protein
MAHEIAISSRRYERVFGHKPRGFGLWYFQLPGGRVVAHTGEYAAACKVAVDHARKLRMSTPILVQVAA